MAKRDSQTGPRSARFSAFEVNFVSRELFKHGTRLKLQKQPFEILCMLLERPGEIVSREALRERLWPDHTFVEYEDSLNTAVRKLRAALSDSSDTPRYIETMPGQGYRFIAAILGDEFEASGVSSSGMLAATTSTPTIGAAEGEAEEERAAVAGAGKPGDSFLGDAIGKNWRLVVGAAVLALALVGAWELRPRAATKTEPSHGRLMLAVLPFDNFTGDATQEYFSDGLTEEMIDQLGKLDPRLFGVIARSSVMQYKQDHQELNKIAHELGVQYVLEGSVRRDGSHVRVSAQLITTKDQSHVWTRQYDRELNDLLSLQGEIARDIAKEIQISLGASTVSAPPAPSALSPAAYEAYDLYLKGQFFSNQRTVNGIERSIEYFKRATEKDPGNARANASLADAYMLLSGYRGYSEPELAVQARSAAQRALQLDDGLPEAHTAMAVIAEEHDANWPDAEKEFRRAIALNANYATAHHWYAEHLAWRGRFAEALQESELARQLDPLSLVIASDRGAILYYAREYDGSIEQLRAVAELDAAFPRADYIIFPLIQEGRIAEARAALEAHVHYEDPISPWYWGNKAYLEGRAGDRAAADLALKELSVLNRRQVVSAAALATAYIGVGQNEKALELLDWAAQHDAVALVDIKVNPIYDPLRSSPRFQKILRKIGLAE